MSALPSPKLRPLAQSIRRARHWPLCVGLTLAVASLQLAGCGSNHAASSITAISSPTQGGVGGDATIVIEAHQGGEARALGLRGVFAGRLVDVYDFDASTGKSTRRCQDFAIGADFVADGVDCVLESDWITETDNLTIRHRADSAAFAGVLGRMDRSLELLENHAQGSFGPFSAVARHATLVLAFDDLLDAQTICAENIRVFLGDPALLPYGARILPDSSHGALLDPEGDGAAQFYTTRVLLDLSVNSMEAMQASRPLEVQPLGVPIFETGERANLVVRIPTRAVPAVGQPAVLSNLAGRGLSGAGNEPLDDQSPTRDVVRALLATAGGASLPDGSSRSMMAPPRVLGVQDITLTSVTSVGGQSFAIDALFAVSLCAPQPRVGDAIRVSPTTVASVVQAGNPPVAGVISGVLVTLLRGSPASFVPGPAQYEMPYDPTVAVPPACFVQFSPPPAVAPDQGVSPQATVRVRFDRMMDPRSVSGMDTFLITRVTNAAALWQFGNTITATVQVSPNLREYTLVPQLPLAHNALLFPAGEEYDLTLVGGANGVLGRTGLPLVSSFPPLRFRLDPAAPTVQSKTIALRFNSTDEDGNGAPELRGQFLFDLSKGTIRGRPVARFAGVADASQPVVGLQIPFTAPIQTPLSNLGSRMLSVYRYHDLGFGVADDSTLNLDLEHLSWAPFATPVVDSFAQFQMAFAHSKFLPDEHLNTTTLLPNFPFSGLVSVFNDNLLDPLTDPATVTHAKQLGYSVQPSDAFVSGTGTLMMPYPMNRGLPLSQFTRYTFRDTGILAVGGPFGAGVKTNIEGVATGSPAVKHYLTDKVPTIGLPLLMEFRCYADAGAFGLNGFKVNLALNSSARPAFRAFSTGGVTAGGSVVSVDPDNEPTARGDLGAPAGTSLPIDNLFYIGQADFVVRVNRVHTIWIDTLTFTGQYQMPVVHPPSNFLPPGTQVLVHLRCVQNLTNGQPIPGMPILRNNANSYDPYGEPKASILVGGANFQVFYPLGPNGLPDNTWKSNPALLANLRFVQARITLISNPVTLGVPEISAVGWSLTH